MYQHPNPNLWGTFTFPFQTQTAFITLAWLCTATKLCDPYFSKHEFDQVTHLIYPLKISPLCPRHGSVQLFNLVPPFQDLGIPIIDTSSSMWLWVRGYLHVLFLWFKQYFFFLVSWLLFLISIMLSLFLKTPLGPPSPRWTISCLLL